MKESSPFQNARGFEYVHTLRPVNDATEGSTQEARRKHPCVLPKKVAFLVLVPDSAMMCASCVLPSVLLPKT